jgi:hypothetical protein
MKEDGTITKYKEEWRKKMGISERANSLGFKNSMLNGPLPSSLCTF